VEESFSNAKLRWLDILIPDAHYYLQVFWMYLGHHLTIFAAVLEEHHKELIYIFSAPAVTLYSYNSCNFGIFDLSVRSLIGKEWYGKASKDSWIHGGGWGPSTAAMEKGES